VLVFPQSPARSKALLFIREGSFIARVSPGVKLKKRRHHQAIRPRIGSAARATRRRGSFALNQCAQFCCSCWSPGFSRLKPGLQQLLLFRARSFSLAFHKFVGLSEANL